MRMPPLPADSIHARACKLKCEKILTRPQIIDLLCQRRSDTVQNLASELGVSERTIRRDIEELTLTYPLETVRGRYGGGVRMADWYFQDWPRLSPKQTALLKRLAVGLHGEDLDEMNQILARFAF